MTVTEPTPTAPGPWLVRLEAKACCATCGAWCPLDGPDLAFVCRLCAQRTAISVETWRDALGEAFAVGHAWERGHVDGTVFRYDEDDRGISDLLQCNIERQTPACPRCRRDLEDRALFADESTCPGCKTLIPVEPVRDGALSSRLRWLLRVPRDPEEDRELAEFERHALDARPSEGSFDRDWLPEALRAGEHVPFGVCWLGLQVEPDSLAAARARVSDALAVVDAALDEAGIAPVSPFEVVLKRARAEDDDDWSEDEDDDDDVDRDGGRDAALGCAVISSVAVGLAVVAVIVAALVVVLLVALVVLG